MFLLPFLLNKAVIVGLSLVVIGSATVYGGVKANDYRQTQIVLQEAKQLSSNGKYQEAINKLTEADNKWSSGGVKREIVSLKEENRSLLQSTSEYKLGKELFDKEKYADAVEVLKKIDIKHINYFDSKSLIELAENKMDRFRGEVAGVSAKSKKATQGTPQVLSTPTPSQVTPLPTPQATPMIDPGKTAELRNIIADIKRQIAIAVRSEGLIPIYQQQLTACLNSVSERINNAPIVEGSRLNFSPSQIESMKSGCYSYQTEINTQTSIYNVAMSKLQEHKDRANILSAECQMCWEEAQR